MLGKNEKVRKNFGNFGKILGKIIGKIREKSLQKLPNLIRLISEKF